MDRNANSHKKQMGLERPRSSIGQDKILRVNTSDEFSAGKDERLKIDFARYAHLKKVG
jgi:hypothetical protein